MFFSSLTINPNVLCHLSFSVLKKVRYPVGTKHTGLVDTFVSLCVFVQHGYMSDVGWTKELLMQSACKARGPQVSPVSVLRPVVGLYRSHSVIFGSNQALAHRCQEPRV